jgi:phosphate transport system permease protein
VRFVSDILLSAPSILIGLFIYQMLVAAVRRLLRLGGARHWRSSSFPIVVRTTEDMLRLIPITPARGGRSHSVRRNGRRSCSSATARR